MGKLNNLGRFFEFISSTVVFILLSVIDAALTYGYTYFSRDLVKPESLSDVFGLIWNHGEEYGLSLLTGIPAFTLTIALAIAALVNITKFLSRTSEDSIVIFCIKSIFAITLVVSSFIFLSGLGSMAIVALGITLLVYLWASN